MNITYFWDVTELQIATENGSLSKIVENVDWSLKATNENNNSVSVFATTRLNNPDSLSFIEFSSLDKDTVINWVKENLGQDVVNSYESNLAVMLNESEQSNLETVNPPWSA
jgi:hypothetical protein